MTDYRNERILIIGLGITGISCANFFISRGITPRIMDTRLVPPELNKLPSNIPCHLGSIRKDWLFNSTLVVVSPGISIFHSELAAALSIGISIVGDIELFVREISAPLVAITGSNGKSTVTSMVGSMAVNAGWNVGIGGNIGTPALDLLNDSCQLYVIELSSFQLETTHSMRASAATVLNINEDHMNRYPIGLNQYRSTKLKIYNNAVVCVINLDDALTVPINGFDTRCVGFGVEQGDYYLDSHLNKTKLMAYGKSVLDCDDMSILGNHNYTNALAALALADAIGIPRDASVLALKKFQCLPHRFELVHDHNGVCWINDSKATNIGSTKAALNNLKSISGTLHLLLGGESKSSSFTSLFPLVQTDRIQLYCFGKDGPLLASLSHTAILVDTLEQAMQIISKRVKFGDLVLLSPACASLDQFNNFEVRGEVFKRLARKLG